MEHRSFYDLWRDLNRTALTRARFLYYNNCTHSNLEGSGLDNYHLKGQYNGFHTQPSFNRLSSFSQYLNTSHLQRKAHYFIIKRFINKQQIYKISVIQEVKYYKPSCIFVKSFNKNHCINVSNQSTAVMCPQLQYTISVGGRPQRDCFIEMSLSVSEDMENNPFMCCKHRLL